MAEPQQNVQDPFAPMANALIAPPSAASPKSRSPFVRIDSVEEQKSRKKMMVQTDPNFGLVGRARAPSVADFEVKKLLSNLTSVSESESEADSSELETEFDITLGKLEHEKQQKLMKSPRRVSNEVPHAPRPTARVLPDRRSADAFWTGIKEGLQRETEKLLENSQGDTSPRTNRRRTRSWLVAKEEMEKALQKEAETIAYEHLPQLRDIVQPTPVSQEEKSTVLELPPIHQAPEKEKKENCTQPIESIVQEEAAESSSEESEGEIPFDLGGGEDASWWESLKETLESEDPVPTPSESSPSQLAASESQGELPPVFNKSPINRQYSKEMITVQKEKKAARRRKGSDDDSKRGVLRFDNGVYRGETKVTPESYSTAHGYGTFHANNGELYIGHWSDGKREGKGIKTWEDGREYIGQWANNRRSGYGIMTHPNGDVYIGELQYGFQQGHGMLRSADGDKYIGEWNVNERHGFGVMHFKNGDIYAGEWQHNKKEGHGLYRFADGKFVEGEWVDNKFAKRKKGDGIFSPKVEKKEKRESSSRKSKSLTKAAKGRLLEEQKKEKEKREEKKDDKERKERREKDDREKKEKEDKEKKEKEEKKDDKDRGRKKTPSRMSLSRIITSSRDKKEKDKEKQADV